LSDLIPQWLLRLIVGAFTDGGSTAPHSSHGPHQPMLRSLGCNPACRVMNRADVACLVPGRVSSTEPAGVAGGTVTRLTRSFIAIIGVVAFAGACSQAEPLDPLESVATSPAASPGPESTTTRPPEAPVSSDPVTATMDAITAALLRHDPELITDLGAGAIVPPRPVATTANCLFPWELR